MTKSLTLYLSLATFEALHEAANGRGKKVTVSKIALRKLLMDHTNALARLKDMQVMTVEK